MTINELLNTGMNLLGKTDLAILDCEVVLAYVLGVEKEYLIANLHEEVDEGLGEMFLKYMSEVRDGKPVAYITNQKEFYGLDFYVDQRVLIPRPDTELMVEKALDFIRKNYKNERFSILDLGTGSGNIAISIAKTLENEDLIEYIHALDISDDAIEVAKQNVVQHGVEDKINVTQSDLLEAIEDEESYDLILANLPYIGEVKHRYIDKNVEKYEPKVALFGGEDGLTLYKKLFQQLRDKHISWKMMAGEINPEQLPDLVIDLNKYFDQNWEVLKDLSGKYRVFVIYN